MFAEKNKRNLTLKVLVTFFLSVTLSEAANPVKKPILAGNLDVHTAFFAQLPAIDGVQAKINSIKPFVGDELLVGTRSRIYAVSSDGSNRLVLDLNSGIYFATGRGLNIKNTVHGGLRGAVIHPNFAENGLMYTSLMEDRPWDPKNYTYLSDVEKAINTDSVLIEWKYDTEAGVFDPLSYRQVLRIGMPVNDHPIKQVEFFGNLLYIAHGDGSVKSATAGGGQRNDALGKILRINPLQSGDRAYTVPEDNAFYNDSSMLSEVFALGFRNPHNLCFSKGGVLYAVDVGRDNIEEVNLVKNGGNYGWSLREGTFVQLEGGEIVLGVAPLPEDDAKLGFEYPAVQVGHEGELGETYVLQAMSGSCPVENGSPLDGIYMYSDFPITGNLYYSTVSDMMKAVTKGNPDELTQAPTWKVPVWFDDDNNPLTPAIKYETLGDIVRAEEQFEEGRADIRFGRGSQGEIYWSSKTNGRIYLITSSVPGGPGGKTGGSARK